MSWLPWRRPTPPPDPPPKREPDEEPEAPQSSFAEKVEVWKARFRAERAAQPTPEQLEAARERRRRAQMEAEEERIAAHVAYKGIYVEGEPLEGPAMPRGDGTPSPFQEQRDDFAWWTRNPNWRP